ncbi:MAG TPA: MFS transporter [Patescibacteria group bacterium]|nr:MFS transporter [Patescibacteria group bacterium]
MAKETFSSRYPAFRSRDFRLLWTGQLISNIGSQMQIVALNWQIYVLTHSAIALGLIGLVRVIPIIIFSLFAGVVADAFNRKKVMYVTQTLLLLFSLVLTIATYLKFVNPLIIYMTTALSAIALSFDLPARQAFLPGLVTKEDLSNALSLSSIMFQTSTVLGPTAAGFLIARTNIGLVYGLNAVSFLAVIIALYRITNSGKVIGDKVDVSLKGIQEGITFIKSKTIIWSTMLLDFFSTFFASATALLPIFAKDILRVGPEGLGLLYAAPAIGAVIAGSTLAHFKILRKEGIVLLSAVTVYAMGTIIFGVSHIFFLSFFALLLVGLGDNVSTIIRNTVRQLATPDSIRGRMTAINMIFFMGGPQLGEFEAGVLASAIGAPGSVIIGGIGTLIVIGVMTLGLPTLRNFDQKTHIPLSH